VKRIQHNYNAIANKIVKKLINKEKQHNKPNPERFGETNWLRRKEDFRSCRSSWFYARSWEWLGGTRWRSWLRHCATSRKVAGSITDGVTGIFHWHNSFGRPGIDSGVTEIFPGGVKGGRWVGLTTLPPSCADCLEIWEPQPPGTLRACPGL
jgi:hypothetical protein